MPGALVRTAMVLDRTRPKEDEDRFEFKPLENHVIFVLSYVSCTFYGKPPRIIPSFAHKSHPTLLQIQPRAISLLQALCDVSWESFLLALHIYG
jgi:hypothetical protein